MKTRFLSYGAGMQTFALLVMAEQGVFPSMFMYTTLEYI